MRLQSLRVLITGASSGIGEACARQFAAQGASLLLCARRGEHLRVLADELAKTYQIMTYPLELDVCDQPAVLKAWQQLPPEWHDIDILINNAGLSRELDSLQTANWKDWHVVIDTNIKGVLHITQPVLQQMLVRQKGHIINIGSIAAYQTYPGGAVYCASKSALSTITDGLKMDVHGTPIRVSLISPGLVGGTEFSYVRFKDDAKRADAVYSNTIALSPDDVADTILYCATRPLHVDIREIVIMPTTQTAVHMQHRVVGEESKAESVSGK